MSDTHTNGGFDRVQSAVVAVSVRPDTEVP
jgi:hypothetical protein